MSTVDVGLTAANTNVPTKPHFDNKSMHEHHQIGSNVLSENKNASITTRNEDNSPNRPALTHITTNLISVLHLVKVGKT